MKIGNYTITVSEETKEKLEKTAKNVGGFMDRHSIEIMTTALVFGYMYWMYSLNKVNVTRVAEVVPASMTTGQEMVDILKEHAHFGVKSGTIQRLFTLTACSPEIRQLIDDGTIKRFIVYGFDSEESAHRFMDLTNKLWHG